MGTSTADVERRRESVRRSFREAGVAVELQRIAHTCSCKGGLYKCIVQICLQILKRCESQKCEAT